VLIGGTSTSTRGWNGINWTDKGASVVANTGYNDNAIAFDASRQAVVMWDGTLSVTWSGWQHGRAWPGDADDAAELRDDDLRRGAHADGAVRRL
jgi:hypothetical protein